MLDSWPVILRVIDWRYPSRQGGLDAGEPCTKYTVRTTRLLMPYIVNGVGFSWRLSKQIWRRDALQGLVDNAVAAWWSMKGCGSIPRRFKKSSSPGDYLRLDAYLSGKSEILV